MKSVLPSIGARIQFSYFFTQAFFPFILFKAAKSVEIAEAFSIFDIDIN